MILLHSKLQMVLKLEIEKTKRDRLKAIFLNWIKLVF